MPSHLHETLVEMFRDRPTLAPEVLAGPLGLDVPEYDQVELSSGDLTEVMPASYLADAVVTLYAGAAAVFAVIVEVQLRTDPQKRRAWPAYVANAYARLGCPAMLLVVCPKAAVAAWCAVPIVVTEPGLSLTPTVLGPTSVPVVADARQAQRSPELAVLSAMAHGGAQDGRAVLDALFAGLTVIDHDHANLYADVVLTVLPVAARDYLEALMTTATPQYQSDFARRYFGQGEARAVLAFLEARGLEISAEARERISGCTDVDQLDVWVRRAATVTKVDELFAL